MEFLKVLTRNKHLEVSVAEKFRVSLPDHQPQLLQRDATGNILGFPWDVHFLESILIK